MREAAKFEKATTDLHHRRTQGVAIHCAHETQARGRVHLQRCAAVLRSARHFKICPGIVPQRRSGPGGRSVHEFHFHAEPKAGSRSASAGRGNQRRSAMACMAQKPKSLTNGATEFLFEPSAEDVLGALLPHYLNFQVYQILLEAKASEHSSRMVAMKNATDNAKQLIKDLTLEYNKLRQANITKELLEITSAAMAMG